MTIFKLVSIIFALASIATGLQAVFDPVGFSQSFGIPLPIESDKERASTKSTNASRSYVSLMGVRQLATGLILLTFAAQGKWVEMATILAILGIVVAGTDGVFLAKSGNSGQAKFHAIPGALIALLAGAVVVSER